MPRRDSHRPQHIHKHHAQLTTRAFADPAHLLRRLAPVLRIAKCNLRRTRRSRPLHQPSMSGIHHLPHGLLALQQRLHLFIEILPPKIEILIQHPLRQHPLPPHLIIDLLAEIRQCHMHFPSIGDVLDDLLGCQVHEIVLRRVRQKVFDVPTRNLAKRYFQFGPVSSRVFQGHT